MKFFKINLDFFYKFSRFKEYYINMNFILTRYRECLGNWTISQVIKICCWIELSKSTTLSLHLKCWLRKQFVSITTWFIYIKYIEATHLITFSNNKGMVFERTQSQQTNCKPLHKWSVQYSAKRRAEQRTRTIKFGAI